MLAILQVVRLSFQELHEKLRRILVSRSMIKYFLSFRKPRGVKKVDRRFGTVKTEVKMINENQISAELRLQCGKHVHLRSICRAIIAKLVVAGAIRDG